MKDHVSKWLLECVGLWVVLIILGLIFGDGSFGEILLAALVMAPIIKVAFALECGRSNSAAPREPHTGMISCKKCGYVGAGNDGYCPRCGWNRTEKLSSNTKMLSCQKCGYLGAGVGHCPRCGSTWTKKVQ